MSQNDDLNKDVDIVLKDAERIGVIGSPSTTTQLTLDILGSAVNKKLVGELAMFSYTQEGQSNYAMGQITEIELQNIWHQDPTIRSLIRQKGSINPVSERQDTHLGQMTVSAVFAKETSEKYLPSILGTIPATGTPICLVTDEVLNALLRTQKDEIFYLGHVYGSKPKLPLWFKHFGVGERGAGEAYHLGVFGKTGSGKSVLAKMIMTGYARHTEMGIFIIDPQGEFSKDATGSVTGQFKMPLKQLVEGFGRELIVCNVRSLVLDTFELFEKILFESDFFQKLSMPKGENRKVAAQELVERLKKKQVRLGKIHERNSFNEAWKILGDENVQKLFYRSEGSRERFDGLYKQQNPDDFFNDYWLPIANLFNADRQNSKKITQMVATALEPKDIRPVVIVDLSEEAASGDNGEKFIWSESIQSLVIKRFLDTLKIFGESLFKRNTLLNTLVVIDEAHRLAPSGTIENDEQAGVKYSLVDAARTTRKYGLGWMFISQTLASLDKEIWGQMSAYFIGFGLSAGTEYRTLQEIVGGDSTALKLYRTFRHPQSSFDSTSKEFPFMTYGPVSPLSFSGSPLFLSAFTSPQAFLNENNLTIGQNK